MDDLFDMFCTNCRTDVGYYGLVSCECPIEDLLTYSDSIDLSYVYPKNTYLITVSGNQGLIYGDEEHIMLVGEKND